MSERRMRRRVVDALRPLDAQAVENVARPGTPDVEYVGGWIELKQVPRWPVRESTTLRIPHYTPQQRAWIQRRSAAGGQVHLLLQVGRSEWLLFGAAAAVEQVGNATRDELRREAERRWCGAAEVRAMLASELVEWLTRGTMVGYASSEEHPET